MNKTIIIDANIKPKFWVGFEKKKRKEFTAYKLGIVIIYFFNMPLKETLDFWYIARERKGLNPNFKYKEGD